MYCSKCGKEIDDNAIICMNCGCPTENYKTNNSTPIPVEETSPETINDRLSKSNVCVFLYGILIIGFIICLYIFDEVINDMYPIVCIIYSIIAIISVIISYKLHEDYTKMNNYNYNKSILNYRKLHSIGLFVSIALPLLLISIAVLTGL